MLSFVGFFSCILMLSTPFVVGKPLTLARVDGASQMLCTHAVLKIADDHPSSSYSRILIQNDAEPDDGYEFLDDDDVNDEDAEERTEREWKKIRRYIKRQLKVPKRYLKKIIRTLNKAASSLRSATDEGDPISSPETDVLSNNLARSIVRFDMERVLVVREPESVEYFAVISAASGGRMYQ